MICFQVIGNDAAVAQAAGAGQLELNVFAPVMVHSILQSLGLLERFIPELIARCIDGIRANEARCRQELRLNPALATLLVPRIGHMAAAELAKEALARSVPVAELAVAKGIVTPAEAKVIFGQGPGGPTRR
jgi:aspartate ammonia-lyase